MNALKLKYTIPLLLITVLAVGGVKIFYRYLDKQFMAEEDPVASTQQKTAAAQPAGPVVNEIDGKVDFSIITRRNLFASRAEAPPEAPPKIPLADIQLSSMAVVLMGTITGPDGDERAIIYDKKANKQELYQEGDFLQQAAIKDIMRGKVVITLNGRDEMLDISDARKVKVPQYQKPGPPVTTTQRVSAARWEMLPLPSSLIHQKLPKELMDPADCQKRRCRMSEAP